MNKPNWRDLEREPMELAFHAENQSLVRRMDQLAWTFVVLGVAARLVRYLLRFPLWGDEIMLAGNFLDRDYEGLLRPLNEQQCAPILFLWTELAVIRWAGFSEWTLRLFPLLCGLGSVFLFRHVAARVMRGVPLAIAVGIFAVAYYPIRHSVELKPYASDVLVALVQLAIAVEWLRTPARAYWLWWLALASAIALGLSYPAVFVAGGISIGLVVPVARTKDRAVWLAYAAFNAAVVGAFALLVWVSFSHQFSASREFMTGYWAKSFPPLADPARLVAWMAETHTGQMFAYPLGGKRGASVLTFLCCVVACGLLARRKWSAIVVMFGGTLGLAFIAACLKLYPYGGNSRLVLYLAPFICLLMGVGGAAALANLRAWRPQRTGVLAAVTLLALVGSGVIVSDMVHPYKHAVDQLHRGFAIWFWNQRATEGDLICVRTDQGLELDPGTVPTAYLCYQRIYSPKHCDGRQIEVLSEARSGTALRCVQFHTTGSVRDESAHAAWLAKLAARHKLVAHEAYPVRLSIPREAPFFGTYEIYDFVLKEGTSVIASAGSGPSATQSEPLRR